MQSVITSSSTRIHIASGYKPERYYRERVREHVEIRKINSRASTMNSSTSWRLATINRTPPLAAQVAVYRIFIIDKIHNRAAERNARKRYLRVLSCNVLEYLIHSHAFNRSTYVIWFYMRVRVCMFHLALLHETISNDLARDFSRDC